LAVNRVLVPTAAGYKYTRDRTSLISDKFSTDGMEMQLPQYQYQSTPVPSIGNVCNALWCKNMDPLGCRHENPGRFPHETSATDTSHTLVVTRFQCRHLVGQQCVVDADLCLAMLHAWTQEYKPKMLCA